MHFSLVKLNPHPEFPASSFDDAILPLFFAFKRLNFQVEIRINSLHPTAKNIIFGANQYSRLPLENIPRNSIIFNLEQLSSGDTWFTPQYVRLLREFQVWDYSARNCEVLKQRFDVNALHVPLGYVEEMTHITSKQPTYDVLFYGTMNKRRVLLLDKLQKKDVGLYVSSAPLWGAERDAKIAAAALVVNIHYHLPASLEVVRLGYLWANKKAVVSERGSDTEIPAGLETACVYCEYEDIPAQVEFLLHNPTALGKQAEEGFNAFSAVHQADILKGIVGRRTRIPSLPLPERCNQSMLPVPTNMSPRPYLERRSEGVMLKATVDTPLIPVMSQTELDLFTRHIPTTGAVLEFGAGGSTRLFVEHGLDKVYSVESDMNWIRHMLRNPLVRNAFEGGKICFVHSDIGPTGDFGHPTAKEPQACWLDYSRGIWPHITDHVPFVLIDGRFRVACTLQGVLRLPESTRYFIHDFNNRAYYHILLEFLDVLESADTAVVCRAKGPLNLKKLCLTLQEFELDAR